MKAIALLLAGFLIAGCSHSGTSSVKSEAAERPDTSAPALSLILVPQAGEAKLDNEIRRYQEQVRAETSEVALEHLGWLFIAKARESFDPGYYKLAEQCGLCLGTRHPQQPEELLLRGYAMQNLHRFKEAEPLARELTQRRGQAFDFGLLGDILMEQGRLAEAIGNYQKMADLKPDLHAFTRAAHVRWLKGDLVGALEMMQLGVSAASPLEPESAAWVHSRVALYLLQAGDFQRGSEFCAAALQFQSNYPPALLVRGKLLIAQGKLGEAVQSLMAAESGNPIPEYQWALADALRAAGEGDEAVAVERRLKETGSSTDPRSFALFLATRGENLQTSKRLATEELQTRSDVFTHDALAWALTATGDYPHADAEMRRALAEGTQDARLFLHAGVLARHLGRPAVAEEFFQRARALRQMLLPSESSILSDNLAAVAIAPNSEHSKSFSQTEATNPQTNITENKQTRNGRS